MKLVPALTLIELLLVIAIVGIIAGTTILSVRGVLDDSAITGSVERMVNVLKTAHNYAREEKDSTSWIVKCTSPNSYGLYYYNTNTNTDDPFFLYTLEQGMEFDTCVRVLYNQSTGFLNGGLSKTIRIKNTSGTKIKTINISPNGVVEVI